MQCSDWSHGGCRRHKERTDGAQSEEEEDGVEEIRWEGQPSPVKTQLSYWQIIHHQSGILCYMYSQYHGNSYSLSAKGGVKECMEFPPRLPILFAVGRLPQLSQARGVGQAHVHSDL